jgi:PTS system galactitol-specific IIA component
MDNAMKVFSADDLLHEDQIMLGVYAENVKELMEQMCAYARKMGFIKDSYLAAVLEREEIYPTGLPTEVMKVALPHTTDKSHVLKSGIFVAKLEKPVTFKEMGDGENDVPVEMVFMLAVNGDKEQLKVLQDIVGIFTKNGVMQALKNAGDEQQIIDTIRANL